MKTSKQYAELKPLIAGLIDDILTRRGLVSNGSDGGGGGGLSAHALSGAFHTGTLADSQGPQFLLTDGSRNLTGNLAVDAGITIDGVDLSVHAANSAAHHEPVTAGDGIVLSTQQVSVDLTATSGLEFSAGDLQISDTISGDGLDIVSKVLSVDVTDIIDTSYGLTENSNNIRVSLSGTSGLEFNVGGLQIADTVAGAGLGIASKVLSVNAGAGLDIAADNVILGTPSTLSASTANSASGTTHTHAVSAYANSVSNPGELLKSDGSGYLTLARLNTQDLRSQSSDLVITPANDMILESTKTWASSDFLDGIPIAGFSNFINTASNRQLTINTIKADELHVRIFVADTVRIDVGEEYWGKSMGVVYEDFTTPGILGGTVSIKIEDSPAFSGALFSNNDWVLIRVIDDTGGGLVVQSIWGQVATYVDNGDDAEGRGNQSWTFTLRQGGTNQEIKAGNVVVSFGASGQGYVHLSTLNSADGPWIQIGTWSGSDPYTAGNRTARTVIGKLDSFDASEPDMNLSGYGLYATNAYLQGELQAADGDIIIDADGVRVLASATGTILDVSAYTFFDSSDAVVSGLYAYDDGQSLNLRARNATDPTVTVAASLPTGETGVATSQLFAHRVGDGDTAEIEVEYDTSSGTAINLQAVNGSITLDASATYILENVGIGTQTLNALLQIQVDGEIGSGEYNALAIYSEGEHIFERDQLDGGPNGTVLGLRRRNMANNEGRAVLRLAAQVASEAAPTTGFAGYIQWQLPDETGSADVDVGWLGYRYRAAPALNDYKTQLEFGVNGSANVTLARMDEDVISLDPNGTGVSVGIGTSSPDGTLHVHTASAGAVTAHASADDLVVENNAAGGMHILVPDANAASLYFGSPSDNLGAFINWVHNNDLMRIGTHTATGEVAIESATGVEAIRIDANQRVGIGTTTPGSLGIAADLAVSTNTQTSVVIESTRSLLEGTSVGYLDFEASANTSGVVLGWLLMKAQGSTAGNRGGNLTIAIKPDGSAFPTTRMEFTQGNNIIATGDFIPGTDDLYDVGASGARWDDIWATNGTIQTSDLRDKRGISESDLGLDFILHLKPVRYRWQNGKRPHYGLIAQDVKATMDWHGADDFAGYIYSEEADRHSLRYGEFIAPMIKAIQEVDMKMTHNEQRIWELEQEVSMLKTRVAELEAM